MPLSLLFEKIPEFLQFFPSLLLLKRKDSDLLEKTLSDPHSKRRVGESCGFGVRDVQSSFRRLESREEKDMSKLHPCGL